MGNEALKGLLARFEFTGLQEGIRLTVEDYRANKHKYRHAASSKL